MLYHAISAADAFPLYKGTPIDPFQRYQPIFQLFYTMNILVNLFLLCIAVTACIGQSFNTACGGISPVTRWRRTERDDTIRMDIDTSICRFRNTPLYFASITGGVGHYLLTGVNAIYEPTNVSFTINVRSIDGADANTLMARSAQWKVQWMGLPQ